MAIVIDKYIEGTHVIIDDTYCVKTQEEIDAILRRLGEIAFNAKVENEARRMREEAANA